MKLRLERTERTPAYTLGRLFVDGVFECWVLEDPARDGPKVYGSTAIPEGVYPILLTFSNRFQKIMPLIADVPGFEGVRIHPGNTVEDTDGCLLVGQDRAGPTVLHSRLAYKALYPKLQAAQERQEPIEIEVTHTQPEAA